MPRKIDDLDGYRFPPIGKHVCSCLSVTRDLSPKKSTPFLRLEWRAKTGELFTDELYLSEKNLSRIGHVARRVCGWDAAKEIPDDNQEAIDLLEQFITFNALNSVCNVTIEEQTEEIMITEGPDVGQKKTKTKRRVAYKGYELLEKAPEQSMTHPSDSIPKDDLPF